MLVLKTIEFVHNTADRLRALIDAPEVEQLRARVSNFVIKVEDVLHAICCEREHSCCHAREAEGPRPWRAPLFVVGADVADDEDYGRRIRPSSRLIGVRWQPTPQANSDR